MSVRYTYRSPLTGRILTTQLKAWKVWGNCTKDENIALHRKASILLNVVEEGYISSNKTHSNYTKLKIAITRFIRGWKRMYTSDMNSLIYVLDYVKVISKICGLDNESLDICIENGFQG